MTIRLIATLVRLVQGMSAGMPRLAMIQVRMGSTRLPGKSMFELGGMTLLEHIVHRTMAVKNLNHIIVATSDQTDDDVIVDLIQDKFASEISVFRGHALDVQQRFLAATQDFEEAMVGRVTADDPFRAPELFAEAFELIENGDFDHVRMTPGTVPVGIDAEVFTLSALRNSRAQFPSAESAEHVTTELLSQPNYRRGEFAGPDSRLGAISLTIDTQDDFDRCSKVADALVEGNLSFSLGDTISALRSLGWWSPGTIEEEAPR